MKTVLSGLTKVFKVLEAVTKYAAVAAWGFCLFEGGLIAIGAAALGVLACAVTCLF